jgi:hypothetical protein
VAVQGQQQRGEHHRWHRTQYRGPDAGEPPVRHVRGQRHRADNANHFASRWACESDIHRSIPTAATASRHNGYNHNSGPKPNRSARLRVLTKEITPVSTMVITAITRSRNR